MLNVKGERTMKTVQAYLDSKQAEFANHPFFKLLETFTTLEQINYFVPELTFWAMTFQDVLRINEEQIEDPYLRKLARHHRLEDSGHDKWFLHDKGYMSRMGEEGAKKVHDIEWLYGKDCRTTRDAVYQIVSESYNLNDEYLHIILVMILESTGHVFFDRVSKQAKISGEDENLQYFSSSHLNVELSHAIFEEEMEKKFLATVLPEDTRRRALLMVDRCYQAFTKMFDGLVIACQQRMLQEQSGVVSEELAAAFAAH